MGTSVRISKEIRSRAPRRFHRWMMTRRTCDGCARLPAGTWIFRKEARYAGADLPASKLTDDVRKYMKAHRLALLAELAANDGLERRCNWTVLVPGCRPFTMISEPITRDEALADVRVRWPGAKVGP